MSHSPALTFGSVVVVCILTALLFEGYCALGLVHPHLATTPLYPKVMQDFLREYYMFRDRRIIQMLPECIVYDPQLLYVLRLGGCTFENREFVTHVSVNGAGFRETTQMRASPKIAVLGDSHAMGWGVDDDETFASLLEKNLGVKVANLAISSYGTARELIALTRIPLGTVETIVIAYHPNDSEENKYFLEHGSVPADLITFKTLQAKSPSGYQLLACTRFLAKRAMEILEWRRKGEESYMGRNFKEEASTFARLLTKFEQYLANKTVVVVEINEQIQNSPDFVQSVLAEYENLKGKGAAPRFTVRTIDLSKHLDQHSYFILDDHMNKRGHQRVAQALIEALRK